MTGKDRKVHLLSRQWDSKSVKINKESAETHCCQPILMRLLIDLMRSGDTADR